MQNLKIGGRGFGGYTGIDLYIIIIQMMCNVLETLKLLTQWCCAHREKDGTKNLTLR